MQKTEYRTTLLADWTDALADACCTGRGGEVADILGLDLVCEDRIVEMIDELIDLAHGLEVED